MSSPVTRQLQHFSRLWRLIRGVAVGRLFDAVLTLLVLNILLLLLRDDYRLSLFGLTLFSPSLVPSLVAAVLWVVAGRLASGEVSSEAVIGWVSRQAPEVLVGALVLVGLVIRVWGLDFGDPLVVHPDERQVSGEVIVMLKNGTLAPREPYVYPTAFKYLLMPAFGLYYVWGLSGGLWDGFADVHRDTFGFYLVARYHSAILGTLTIFLTYLLARRFWPGVRGRWVGAVAALFMTFSFNHVRQSHFGVTDVPMTFFIMLALVAMTSMYRDGRPRDYLISGCLVGIACATKYNALPVVFVLGATHFLGRPVREWLSLRLVIGLGAVPVGFFLGYPYALLNWRPFLDHLGKWGERTGAVAFEPARRLASLGAYSMESGLGFVFSLLLLLAVLYFVHSRKREDLLIVTMVVATLMVLTHSSARLFPRYLLPMIPAATILVSRLLFEASDHVRRLHVMRLRPRWLAPAGVALLAALAVWPQAVESIEFSRNLSREDTRAAAYEYLVRRFPPGSTVASEVKFLRLPRGYRLLDWRPLDEERFLAFAREQVDVVVFSSENDRAVADEPARFEKRTRLRRRFEKLLEFSPEDGRSPGPTIGVYLNHPAR